MEKFKSVIFLIVILAAVITIGYWAIRTIEPGDIHAERQALEELRDKNSELEAEVARLKNELSQFEPKGEEAVPPAQAPEEESPAPTPAPATSAYKYQGLISELEKLVADNVIMKEKSRGTRVGTLQSFLNLYNGTSKKVDNDYGKTTKADVIAFQKAVGLTADGQTGPTTYQKMIDWLKKQG